jgi:hypothetical protein
MKYLSAFLFLILLTPLSAIGQWTLHTGLMLHENDRMVITGQEYSPGVQLGGERALFRFGREEDLTAVLILNVGYWNAFTAAQNVDPCSDCQVYRPSGLQLGGALGIRNHITQQVSVRLSLGSTYSFQSYTYLKGRDLAGTTGKDFIKELIVGTAGVELGYMLKGGNLALYTAYQVGMPLYEDEDYSLLNDWSVGMRVPLSMSW